ncbi:MAG: twin-arginine translocation signal domain-containing protein [Gammaproteobacteria bacterium]|nr:twin-arginine translocation signal domain-containing protein [Gammaproteobacteria bacterium]
MKKNRQKLDTSKRDFIKKSALAGAGVVTTAVVCGEAVATVADDDVQSKQNKGYQLTPHVLEYYKSAAS